MGAVVRLALRYHLCWLGSLWQSGRRGEHRAAHVGLLLSATSMFTTCAVSNTGGMERFYETEGYESGSNVLRMVGYFALVGLLRVHTLVGDYGGALAALAPIHPFQRAHLFTPKIAGAPGALS